MREFSQQRPLRHAMGVCVWSESTRVSGTVRYLLLLLAQSEVALDLLLLELLLGRQDLLAHLPSLELAFAFGLNESEEEEEEGIEPICVTVELCRSRSRRHASELRALKRRTFFSSSCLSLKTSFRFSSSRLRAASRSSGVSGFLSGMGMSSVKCPNS
jgi:hypothetical protein